MGDPEGTSCFFYRAEGHGLVCSKVILTMIPRHTQWIDSGATTHINVFIQGYLNYRKLNNMSDGKKVEVEAIENFRLLLKTKFY